MRTVRGVTCAAGFCRVSVCAVVGSEFQSKSTSPLSLRGVLKSNRTPRGANFLESHIPKMSINEASMISKERLVVIRPFLMAKYVGKIVNGIPSQDAINGA